MNKQQENFGNEKNILGMLAFEAGKAIIQSMSTPFNYNGQNYYWDQHPNVRNSDIECSLSIDELQKVSAFNSVLILKYGGTKCRNSKYWKSAL
uniref:Uncharacterized protein n=1 Tax=Angiostrongylus cantonensis TaxID=6313 RepID=A0A0K0D2T4_ANGCA